MAGKIKLTNGEIAKLKTRLDAAGAGPHLPDAFAYAACPRNPPHGLSGGEVRTPGRLYTRTH